MTPRLPIAPSWRGAAFALGLAALFLGSTSEATPQDPPPPPPPPADRGGDRPPPPPDRLFRALDRDGDGVLSPGEIRDAAASLRGLDGDGDGALSRDELFPARPPRGPRPPEAPADRDPNDAAAEPAVVRAGVEKVTLVFRGGHDLDPRDRGRPVVLVAGALGVTPEVFRDAFRKVTPSPAGTPPHPDLARRNKAALLAALGPYGLTNDEIDAASNRYRYVPGRGETWPQGAAAGQATFRDGVLTSVVITRAGYGYTSPPIVSAPGHPDLALESRVSFGRDLERNGSVSSVAKAGGR